MKNTSKFLIETIVSSEMKFETNDAVASFLKVPNNEILELHIQNYASDGEHRNNHLLVRIVFASENFETAVTIGRNLANEFCDLCTFVLDSKTKLEKIVKIIDWEAGEFERDVLWNFDFEGIPLESYPIDPDLLFHPLSVYLAIKDSYLLKAVHWFSQGMHAQQNYDKFRFFWFAIELIAANTKFKSKVHDLCVRCQSPLYCENCKCTPSHKPFPTTKMKELLTSHSTLSEDEFEILRKNRNSMMHGDVPNKIHEQASMKDAVNILAKGVYEVILFKITETTGLETRRNPSQNMEEVDFSSDTLCVHMKGKTSKLTAEYTSLEKIGTLDVSLI